MTEQEFIQELNNHGIEVNSTQLILFQQYYDLLLDYNNKINLTTITDKGEVFLKHFYDSISLLFAEEIPFNSTICDVGAGAGFPSIPLKIIRPDLKITIVDSLGKRITFLEEVIKSLNLNYIQAIHARSEEFALTHRESFDFVTARAVARLSLLAELCIPLVSVNGSFIAMKGSSGQVEQMEANRAITLLGCEHKKTFSFHLPHDGGERSIIQYKKTKKTPDKYPRNYSQMKNKPL